jgi:hypothetical protein
MIALTVASFADAGTTATANNTKQAAERSSVRRKLESGAMVSLEIIEKRRDSPDGVPTL